MWRKTTPILGWLLVSIEPDAIERASGPRLLCSKGQGERILVRILFLTKKILVSSLLPHISRYHNLRKLPCDIILSVESLMALLEAGEISGRHQARPVA